MRRSALQYLMVGLALLLISTQGHAAFWGENSSEPGRKDKVYPRKVTRFDNLSSHKDNRAKYQPDKILVKYKPGVTEAAKEKQHKKHGSTRIKALKPLNVHHLKLKKGLSVEEAVKLYQADPNVAYAEPDFMVTAAAITPNDSYYSTSGSWSQPYQDMWGLHKIKSGEAWEITQGSSEVIVAVSDTGLDLNHPDIQANLWINPSESTYNGIDDDGNSFVDDRHGWNFFSGNNNPNDDHGHGTHVSGTIAAATNNGIGVAGISWNAKIMALKFLNSAGSGSTADGAATIIYAADNGAKVVNCSWGGGGRSQTLEDAINYAFSRGTVVVAAAGNSASDAGTFFPAGYENVITVAATDSNDVKAGFSNYGNAVEVSAPGVDILSLRSGTTDLYGDGTHIVGANYYRANGTSMAAPHVSGVAALLFSQYPAWSNKQVMAQIVGSTDDIGNPSIGSGRINALAALSQSASRLRLVYLGRSLDDQSGNGNGMLDAGENVNVVVSIKNYAAAANATVTLASADPYVTVLNGTAALGTVGPWDSASNSSAPFVISVSPDAPQLHNVSFTVTISGDNGNYTNSAAFEERVSPFLPGWPVQVGQGSRPVVLADMDGDGVDEVISYSDKIYVVKGDGTSLPGWPQAVPPDNWMAPLTVGDLDGDGSAEIVLAGYENLYSWNRDGSFSKGFPIQVPVQPGASPEETIYPGFLNTVLADFDGDGYLEIAGVSYWQGKVYMWRHDGMPMPGWPIAIETADSVSTPTTLAAGDLDGDGRPELVVPVQQGKVYAWHHDGTAAAGWPVLLPNYYPMSVTLADTGNDGKANVFVCTGWQLHGFYGDGSPMPGWPQDGNLPAVGDINGDGELDIVADGWGQVLAYSKDGAMLPGWPQPHLSNTLDSPSLADVDGDGAIDVLVRTMGGIYGWHGGGTALAEFPIASTDENQIGGSWPVALGDINGDGWTDLVAGSGPDGSRIHAYQMSGQYLPQLAPWPMSQHDAQGTTTLIHTPVIISSALSGVLGVPFSQRLEAKGGYAPYSWELAGGALPPGLSLDGNTGEVYGTPGETGTFGCTVRLFDANGATVSKPVSIEIQLVAITTTTLGYGTIGTPYSQSLAAAGGTAPYGWAVVAGALPPGLALNPATGVIAGVPTASGSYGLTVQVTDAQGVQAAREYSITVYQWADKSMPGRYSSGIAVDGAGNLYVTGLRYAGVSRLFASKYGPAGNVIWERELSGTFTTNITPDAAGNAYVAGYDQSRAFLSKHDTDGNRLWIRYHDNGISENLGVDASGNAYLSGRPAVYGSAPNFLIKYDAAGGVLWEKVAPYAGSGGMAFDSAGNLYCNFAGQVVKYDQFGNELWSRGYASGQGSIAIDQSNNVIVLGSYALTKRDPAGNELWYVVPEGMEPVRAALDGSGNSYVTGYSFNGSALDMVTRKYDSSGALIWSKGYDTGLNEVGEFVAADQSGQGVYVAGSVNGGDLFIQRYVQPTITTTALPEGTVDQPYSFVMGASGGATPYTWSALPGTLPAGLSLESSAGVISGAPLSSGVYSVSVRAAGFIGLSDLKTFVLTVHPSPTASPAEFSATPLVGEAPLLVNFTDASGNSPLAWSWLLGDGGTANEQNPSHLYLTPGSYSVSLTAVGASGFESVTKPGYITVLACTKPAVRLMGAPQSSFADINEAYDAAMEYDLIQLMAVEQAGALLFNRDIFVTLSGGYDCRYGANPGKTALTGSLRVTGGTVALDNVRFK